MNPKHWLYILPISLVVVLIIINFTRVSVSQEVSAYTPAKKVASKVEKTRKPPGKPVIDTVKLTDTARTVGQRLPEDTLWQAFKPKLKAGIWKAFFDIQYEHKGVYGYYPKFTAKHRKYHNQVVEISGYMYPLTEDRKQTFFMLSFFPIQQCFFCGGAGPESIVEVNSPKGIRLSSKRIRLKGKLVLNTKNPERLFYILNDAVEM
ncbi:hypothetical protein [Microscilla marina]|uniref:DUF3299 domain-containing protein n=1 Tax=Microscilla marina ATCC 23134 TaxID=313606 RepID=A1ZSS5_MICM2|nr:hypothetical protein [Microscilla marina]EAY26489.1 hypothetical protein M23134_01659 [Microscilla marina ATCC 23134]